MNKIHFGFRVLLAFGALTIIACYFLPLWQIKLWAPQYPEGLGIEIWHNDLKGDVDVINGLNHYIGMKLLKPEMFPEFAFLKYIIAGFVLYTLFTAWKGNRKWLQIYCIVIGISGLIALGDFYRWGYDYGHNLDPHAPIQVPGMAYQPPVIGYKVLLNFTALSMPDTGGWLIVGLGILSYMILFVDKIKSRKKRNISATMLIGYLTLTFTSCNKATPQINFGTENCDYCKMTIMDNRFGVALVTDKGRTYKFDDINCQTHFVEEKKPALKELYVVTFDKPGNLTDAQIASYKKSQSIKSPMGSGIAAFSNESACKNFATSDSSKCLSWSLLK
jgi:copper chaperone NosL